LASPKYIDNFKEANDENIRAMMEMMKQQYLDVLSMPYDFFIKTLKWKADLEEERRKKIEETTKTKHK